MPDKKNNLGSSTRRVLFDFLGELKTDQDKKETTRKEKKSEPQKSISNSDIRLFSKKLSENNQNKFSETEEKQDLSRRKEIVLSDEEASRLMALKKDDEQ